MEVLAIATTLLAILGLVATAAGAESRDGYESAEAGRSIDR